MPKSKSSSLSLYALDFDCTMPRTTPFAEEEEAEDEDEEDGDDNDDDAREGSGE